MNRVQSLKYESNDHVRPDDPSKCENRKQSTATGYSTQIQQGKESTLLIEVSVPSDFGLNNAEIKKMTKYQDLKNEVKISWNLNYAKIVPVIIGATRMMKKNLMYIPQTIAMNINTNKLQLEAVWGSVMILKRVLGTKLSKLHKLVHES